MSFPVTLPGVLILAALSSPVQVSTLVDGAQCKHWGQEQHLQPVLLRSIWAEHLPVSSSQPVPSCTGDLVPFNYLPALPLPTNEP